MTGVRVSLSAGDLRGGSHSPAIGSEPKRGAQPTQPETQIQTQLGDRARRIA